MASRSSSTTWGASGSVMTRSTARPSAEPGRDSADPHIAPGLVVERDDQVEGHGPQHREPDALQGERHQRHQHDQAVDAELDVAGAPAVAVLDRKSTRLNSSHVRISYAVFCLKK